MNKTLPSQFWMRWHYLVIMSLRWTSHIPRTRGVTSIFFWGGKVSFPDFFSDVKWFFPVENSHFGRPKTNFRCFQFSFFSSQFSPLFLFSLPPFPPICQQKFPGQKSLGGTLSPAPAPRLLRHCLAHVVASQSESKNWKYVDCIENTEIAQSRTWGIFIRNTAYFTVIQWSMTLPCLRFIESHGVCHIPYENASCTGLHNLVSDAHRVQNESAFEC